MLKKTHDRYVEDPEYISSDDSFPEDIAENKVDPEIEVEQLAQELGINQKKLMWKIDLWVVPPFCLYISFHFLDRVNISNANIYGLTADLKLTGNQYNTALTVFSFLMLYLKF